MKKVAILYGFGEGAWHARKLKRILADAKFTYTDNVAEADILIAHSGGSFLVPADRDYECIMHVNLTYYALNGYTRKFGTKLYRDARYFFLGRRLPYFFYKSLHNASYLVRQPKRAVRMYRATRKQKLPPQNAQKVIVVRNRHDPWLIQNIYEIYEGNQLSFVSFPGEHDDIWEHPERYVSLLRSI